LILTRLRCFQILDSKRLLHFAIDQKLEKDLKDSYDCIKDLFKDTSKVKKILDSSNTSNPRDGLNTVTYLTALCDLLTVMILAMDENQRLNMKPIVDDSKKDILNERKIEQTDKVTDSEINQKELESNEIDLELMDILQKDFKNRTHNDILRGQA
jgi:hypothetical protein